MKNATIKIPQTETSMKDWVNRTPKNNSIWGEAIVLFIFLFVICPAFLWVMHIMEATQ